MLQKVWSPDNALLGSFLSKIMIYTENSHINKVEDVKVFFHHLLYELNVNFHPDDDFKDFVNTTTHEPSFNDEDAVLYNRLMDESFEVCEKANIDIYEIGLSEFKSLIA